MAQKAYVLLYNYSKSGSVQLVFPLKRDDAPNYKSMPQFFGGTKNPGESDSQAIDRELKEESNKLLSLVGAKLTRIHSTTIGADTYAFYVSNSFSGTNYIGDLKNNTEMKAIVGPVIPLGEKDPLEMDDLRNLIKLSSISADFGGSETYTAFEKALEWFNDNLK